MLQGYATYLKRVDCELFRTSLSSNVADFVDTDIHYAKHLNSDSKLCQVSLRNCCEPK